MLIAYFLAPVGLLGKSTLPTGIRDHLSALSSSSLLEPAYSLGSLGFSFGVSQNRLLKESKQDELIDTLDPSLTKAELQTVHIAKGFAYPINVGISVGQFKQKSIYSYGSQLQWTLFEGFRLPSFALRSGLHFLQGVKALRQESYQIAALIDYSLLPHFTPYIGFQRNWHHAELNQSDASLLNLANHYGSAGLEFDKNQSWQKDERIIGAKLKLPSIFLAISGEVHIGHRYQSLWLKFGLGT